MFWSSFAPMIMWVAAAALLSTGTAQADAAESDASQELIKKSQAFFALDLVKQAYKSDKQMLLSPFSIAAAMILPHLGIKARSQEKIYGLVAQKGIMTTDFYRYVKDTAGSLTTRGFDLRMAICFFIHNTLPIKPLFEQGRRQFDGTVLGFKRVDFAAPQKTASVVNGYVSVLTHGAIKTVLEPTHILEDRPALIVDAVFFSAAWKTPFDAKRTFPKDIPGVGMYRMMRATAEFLYEEKEGYKVLGIPFYGENAKMVIILPDAPTGLPTLLHKLTAQDIIDCIKVPANVVVEVQIPTFTVRKTVQVWDLLSKKSEEINFALNDQLSGITEDPASVSHLIYKTVFDINEHGVNAPAIVQHSVQIPQSIPVGKFHADHPFLYLVESEGVLLFAGTYP